MLEGAAKLRPVIGKGFLLAQGFTLLLLGLTIKPTQDMLDALDCPSGFSGLRLAL